MKTSHPDFKITFMSFVTVNNSDLCFRLSNHLDLINCYGFFVETFWFTKFARSMMILGFS